MGKRRILIVDDDAAVSGAVRAGLENSGRYEAAVENDPLKAVGRAQRMKPDLILLDVIMPGKDGGQVAAEIRQHPHLKDTPIIFLTSIVNKSEEAAAGGFIGEEPFVAKPVSLAELLARIEESLRARRPGGA